MTNRSRQDRIEHEARLEASAEFLERTGPREKHRTMPEPYVPLVINHEKAAAIQKIEDEIFDLRLVQQDFQWRGGRRTKLAAVAGELIREAKEKLEQVRKQ